MYVFRHYSDKAYSYVRAILQCKYAATYNVGWHHLTFKTTFV
jgi:hypothetical protein